MPKGSRDYPLPTRTQAQKKMHFWVSKLFLLVPKIVCLALDLEPYLSSGTTPYIRHHTFHRSSIANVEIYGAILSSRGKRHNPFGKGHNPSDTHTHHHAPRTGCYLFASTIGRALRDLCPSICAHRSERHHAFHRSSTSSQDRPPAHFYHRSIMMRKCTFELPASGRGSLVNARDFSVALRKVNVLERQIVPTGLEWS